MVGLGRVSEAAKHQEVLSGRKGSCLVCLEVTGNWSEGHVALTDKSSHQDSSDVWLSVTLPVVLPVDVDKDRVNREYPSHTPQVTGQGDRGELISNLEVASERVSLKGKPWVSSKVN